MPEERASKSVLNELHCIESKEKQGLYECHVIKPEKLDDTDYLDPSTVSKTLIKHQQTHETPTSVLITSIVLTALIGGFGFAVAYILLYLLYDWVVNPLLQVDMVKLIISIAILLTLLTILVIASYYIIKKGLHVNPKYPFGSSPIQIPFEKLKNEDLQEEFADDPNRYPVPRKDR